LDRLPKSDNEISQISRLLDIVKKAMIPEFNVDGNLPEGIYSISEEEFLDHFATSSARRKWLGEGIKEIFALAKSTGKAERIFVWGSFITAKESPNDVDILLVMSKDFQLEAVPEECKHLFDYFTARVRYNADVFWSKASIGEDMLSLWLETYQLTKDFKRRGIVEVKLS
jgi:predicted nucleotidyltransferase